MTNDELLHKWINGKLTAEELDLFKLRPEYESLAELYRNTENITSPEFDSETMLADILKKEKIIPLTELKSRRVFLSNWVKYAAAASLLIIAGWFVFSNTNREVIYTMAKGEMKEGVLPDHSMFALNAESTLSYDKKTWKKERSLDLKGEAFFSVSPGSKFTVKTPTGNVQVLGTQFNVRSRGKALDVKCTHGKVAVLRVDGTVIAELTQYEAIRIEPGKEPEKYQLPNILNDGWVQGITKLRKVTLAYALEELERQYNVEINTGDLILDEIISCNFQHKDLALALKTTLSPLGIVYEIKNNKTVFLKNE